MTIEQTLIDVVEEHYAAKEPGLLLLSTLGTILSDRGVQTDADDRRTLFEIVEKIDKLSIVRDPHSPAFIAITTEGDEERAEEAISRRHRRAFLKGLPLALLLAFTIEIPEDRVMAVQLEPTIVYSIGEKVGDGWIGIDSDLRVVGIEPREIDELAEASVEKLDVSVRKWCERHEIAPSSLARKHRSRAPGAQPCAEATIKASGQTALDRLLQAQTPAVGRQIAVPIDIALALSRMP